MSVNRIESITVAPSAGRQSTPSRFEAALEGATRNLAAGLVAGAEAAAPAVPFGTVLAGAVRGATGGLVGGTVGGRNSALLATRAAAGPTGAAGSGDAAGGTSGTGGATTSQGDILEATRALQQEGQALNLQYLQLQEQMQQENREFTAVSNVMRVKHDSARNAISNIH